MGKTFKRIIAIVLLLVTLVMLSGCSSGSSSSGSGGCFWCDGLGYASYYDANGKLQTKTCSHCGGTGR